MSGVRCQVSDVRYQVSQYFFCTKMWSELIMVKLKNNGNFFMIFAKLGGHAFFETNPKGCAKRELNG